MCCGGKRKNGSVMVFFAHFLTGLRGVRGSGNAIEDIVTMMMVSLSGVSGCSDV